MNNKIFKIEKKLGLKFKNSLLLKQALIHKSKNSESNNERLEFLGDRVIGLVISKALLDLYPDEKEGLLDKKLSNLVNKKTCALIAEKIGLNKYIMLGDLYKKKTDINDKILSDSCEALIGAIFIDKGFEYASKFVLDLWSQNLDKSDIAIIDAKTQLQEYSLKNFKELPKYILISSSGPIHNPTFKISAQITNSKKFIGSGNSKRQAQQNAAEKLLKTLNNP